MFHLWSERPAVRRLCSAGGCKAAAALTVRRATRHACIVALLARSQRCVRDVSRCQPALALAAMQARSVASQPGTRAAPGLSFLVSYTASTASRLAAKQQARGLSTHNERPQKVDTALE